MADELNIPIHRWYEPRNNISLPNSDFSKQWIYDSGIQKIDRWINSQPWGNPINALFALAEPGVWFDPSDLTTLFQDSTGTTTVTTPGQTVGLMLDKSRGLDASTKGGQMDGVVGGSFDTPSATANQITGDIDIRVRASLLSWTPAATTTLCSRVLTGVSTGDSYEFWISTSGVLQLLTVSGTTTTNVASSASVGFAAGTTNWVRVTWQQSTGFVNFYTSYDGVTWTQNGTANRAGTTSATNAGTRLLRFGARSDGASGSFPLNGKIYRGQIYNGINGTLAVDFNPTLYASGATYTAATGEVWTITGLYARIVPDGSHATQATLAARPTYSIEPVGGRRNLLLWTEAFEQSPTPWSGFRYTLAANATAAPDGTTTADAFTQATGQTAWGGIGQTFTATAASYVFSCYVKANGKNFVSLGGNLNGGGYVQSWFNLSTGTPGTRGAGHSASSIVPAGSVGSGWYRCSITFTATAATWLGTVGLADTDNSNTVTDSGGLFIWGAQLEQSSTATAYQRVTTQHDVTEAGVASVGYLWFDGVSNNMVTSSVDFTSTNKMTAFAGYRAIEKTGSTMMFELSNVNSNVGSFSLNQGPTAGTTGFGALMNTGSGVGAQTDPLTIPYTSVASLKLDSALVGIANEISLRMNGTVTALPNSIGSDSGTGNFGNYPFYIGARGGSAFPFKGHIYSLIARGAATDAPTITSTETWVAGKTGFYTPIITGVPTIGVS